MSIVLKASSSLCLTLAICFSILGPGPIFGTSAAAQTASMAPRSVASDDGISWSSVAAPAIRTNVDLVLLNVRVLDNSGGTVNGLATDNFSILEDKQPQQLKYFSTEDAPISIGLLLDLSGSMETKIAKARLAVSEFLRTSNPRDEFFLITFGDRPEMLSGFTTDWKLLVSKVESADPQGETALIDAVHAGLQAMRNAKYDRKALVLISDGQDNHSRYSERDVQRELRESDVQVFCVGIYSDTRTETAFYPHVLFCDDCDMERAGKFLLTHLAETSGGRLFTPKRLDDLPGVVTKVSQVMRSVYVLGYTPSNQKHDGKWRKTEVRITSAPVRKYRVLNRSGYYAPADGP